MSHLVGELAVASLVASVACELRGLDRADEAADFAHGQDGRNNARGKHGP